MASGTTYHALFAAGTRALRLFGIAGLAVAAAATGCGKVSSTDVTGTADVDSVSYTLSVELPATSVRPLGELSFTISATDKNGNVAKDGTVLTLSADSLGTVSPTTVTLADGQATAKFTAGSSEGTAEITVKYDSRTRQTVSVNIDKSASTSTGGSTSSTGDQFPYGLSKISWDEPAGNVGEWPVVGTISSGGISLGSDRLTIVSNVDNVFPHVMKDGWAKPTTGNYWVIGNVGGEWHAATIDYVGIGRTGCEVRFDGTDDIHGKLGSWRPHRGEEAYVMISTHARAGVLDGNKKRTQIFKITVQ